MKQFNNETIHKPVLLHETIKLLDLKKGSVVLDGTVGGGGHAREICKRIGKEGTLIALDLDKENIARAKEALADCEARIIFANENFRNLDKVLEREGIEHVDAVLLDLGLSSFHLEDSGRGFSFRKDEPLTMTFSDAQADITARNVVNEWSEETLADIFKGFGEERFAKRIARAIAEKREESPIESTEELTETILDALPQWLKSKHKNVTRIFQAIRIAVNDERGALEEGLEKGASALSPEGVMAIISFHSGEDRMVKRFFKGKALSGEFEILTKRPVTPSSEEIAENSRARSAKLRVAKKVSANYE